MGGGGVNLMYVFDFFSFEGYFGGIWDSGREKSPRKIAGITTESLPGLEE